ncbi:hypothetical protein Tco_0902547 [Tanacetum coccineum]
MKFSDLLFKTSDSHAQNMIEYHCEWVLWLGVDERKGAGTQKESQICCGQFIFKIARKSRVLTDHVIKNWSAPIYCRDLDTTTLRDLIDSEGRLIPDDLQPGVPRVGIPRPPRASMQNLYDGMGRMEIPMRRQRGWSIGIQIIGTGTGEV